MKNPEYSQRVKNDELIKTLPFLVRKIEVQNFLMERFGFSLKEKDPKKDSPPEDMAQFDRWATEGYAGLYDRLLSYPEGQAALMREGRKIEDIVDMFEKLLRENEGLRENLQEEKTPVEKYRASLAVREGSIDSSEEGEVAA